VFRDKIRRCPCLKSDNSSQLLDLVSSGGRGSGREKQYVLRHVAGGLSANIKLAVTDHSGRDQDVAGCKAVAAALGKKPHVYISMPLRDDATRPPLNKPITNGRYSGPSVDQLPGNFTTKLPVQEKHIYSANNISGTPKSICNLVQTTQT